MLKKLESLRGFAALYVFIHHYIGFSEIRNHISPLLRFPFRFGQEAVILFFLLSGFVIHYSTHSKTITFKDFFLKRVRRIYPVLLCSMFISFLVFYINGYDFKLLDLYEFIGNIFMIQDLPNKPGLWVNVFLQNHALWSLSYEFIFYLIYFPLISCFGGIKRNLHVVLLISVIGWISYLFLPNHLSLVISYLIIWWAGVKCASIYLEYGTFTVKTIKPILSCLLIITSLSLIPLIQFINVQPYRFNPFMYPVITVRHFAFSAVVLLLGLTWWKFKLVGFDFLFKPFQRFASISYGIYVIHFPILWLNITYFDWVYVIIVKVALVLTLSYLIEMWLQPKINGYLIRFKN